MLKTCTAFVTYNRYGGYEWTKICVTSFRNVFGMEYPLIAVDHNHNPEEKEFLKKNQVQILENYGEQSHGEGLDIATAYAKKNGFDAIVFIEPDCLFFNDTWYKNMHQIIESGKSMTSVFRWPYGPLHPCGSMWVIKNIPYSFKTIPKTKEEVGHVRFQELLNMPTLCALMAEEKYDNHLHNFFVYHWDVGIKNWYTLEVNYSTQHCIDDHGFVHFWRSHGRPPSKVIRTDPWCRELLKPWVEEKEIMFL